MQRTRSFTNRCDASRSALLIALALASTACASLGRKEKQIVANTATGDVTLSREDEAARIALRNAADDRTAAARIERQMDEQAEELRLDLSGGGVERVGEGIEVTFADGLLFSFGSDTIRTAARENLKALAANLRKFPNTRILITGHTDASGTAAYNQDLSVRRANSAAAYLAAQGIDAQRLRANGKGKLEPIATNETNAGRKANRRIVVSISAIQKESSTTR
jgi:outer membrane protein OmpA-like peptidoglycan-associated protein